MVPAYDQRRAELLGDSCAFKIFDPRILNSCMVHCLQQYMDE